MYVIIVLVCAIVQRFSRQSIILITSKREKLIAITSHFFYWHLSQYTAKFLMKRESRQSLAGLINAVTLGISIPNLVGFELNCDYIIQTTLHGCLLQ